MDKIRPGVLLTLVAGSIFLPAPLIAMPPAFGLDAVFFHFFVGTTWCTTLAVGMVIYALFQPRPRSRKYLVALLIFLVGPTIDYTRMMKSRNFYATSNEVYEQRKKLPITAEMEEKIKHYVTIQKADMWINEGFMTVSQRLVLQLDVKKAGGYVVWEMGMGQNYFLKEGVQTVEMESHIVVNEDSTSWLKVQYMATARQVFGSDYPNVPGGGDLDLDKPVYFTVMPDSRVPVTVHKTQSPGMPDDSELLLVPNQ